MVGLRTSYFAGDLPISHVRFRLRQACEDAHQRLEAGLGVVEQLSGPERAGLVSRYRAFHEAAESAMAPWLVNVPGLEFEARQRAPLFSGMSGGNAATIPTLRSRSEALGFLYVTEGSTLGGRLILRELADRGTSLEGLGFLDPYRAETGARWRSFLAVLECEVGESANRLDEAIAGASKGFAFAEECLRERDLCER
jgi:heme oxygenase